MNSKRSKIEAPHEINAEAIRSKSSSIESFSEETVVASSSCSRVRINVSTL
jgi:hypothetical protein